MFALITAAKLLEERLVNTLKDYHYQMKGPFISLMVFPVKNHQGNGTSSDIFKAEEEMALDTHFFILQGQDYLFKLKKKLQVS